ncbi:hypothetical protein E2C01_023367 [Portunus trituberculatus]|uniref:Uncharacterized protein n=1 Tax=Portunus trituberculatus TaxID=210409 RepID=A0A5B7E7T7_PORTR|nr:hypothetical protein [Portunus trituberculatus]
MTSLLQSGLSRIRINPCILNSSVGSRLSSVYLGRKEMLICGCVNKSDLLTIQTLISHSPIYVPTQNLAIKARSDQDAILCRVFNILDPVSVALQESNAPLEVAHIPKGNIMVITA